MDNDSTPKKTSSAEFLTLLIEQFKGIDGELPMAIRYLTQAADDSQVRRKNTMVRIARAKIRHADILGSILLQIVLRRSGPRQRPMPRRTIKRLLEDQGLCNGNYDQATTELRTTLTSARPRHDQKHTQADPRRYLSEYVTSEKKQISVYEALIGLTSNQTFLSALHYAKDRQVQHLRDIEELLRRALLV
jgi:Mn-containing catalase